MNSFTAAIAQVGRIMPSTIIRNGDQSYSGTTSTDVQDLQVTSIDNYTITDLFGPFGSATTSRESPLSYAPSTSTDASVVTPLSVDRTRLGPLDDLPKLLLPERLASFNKASYDVCLRQDSDAADFDGPQGRRESRGQDECLIAVSPLRDNVLQRHDSGPSLYHDQALGFPLRTDTLWRSPAPLPALQNHDILLNHSDTYGFQNPTACSQKSSLSELNRVRPLRARTGQKTRDVDSSWSPSEGATSARDKSQNNSIRRAKGRAGRGAHSRRAPDRRVCNTCAGSRRKKFEFRGQHELDRHINKQHSLDSKFWKCLDPTPDRRHSWCKKCSEGKLYAVNYNAAEHLRRAHLNADGSERLGKRARGSMRGGQQDGKGPRSERSPSIQDLIQKGWMRRSDHRDMVPDSCVRRPFVAPLPSIPLKQQMLEEDSDSMPSSGGYLGSQDGYFDFRSSSLEVPTGDSMNVDMGLVHYYNRQEATDSIIPATTYAAAAALWGRYAVSQMLDPSLLYGADLASGYYLSSSSGLVAPQIPVDIDQDDLQLSEKGLSMDDGVNAVPSEPRFLHSTTAAFLQPDGLQQQQQMGMC